MRLKIQRSDKAGDAVAYRPRPPARPEFSGNQARLRQLSMPRIQAKLEVGRVDDPLEREADAAADRVMRMPDRGPGLSTSPAQVSRKCDECEDQDKQTLRTKRDGVQPGQGGIAHAVEAPPIVHDVLAQSGQPLDGATRAFFEPRFDHDLGAVRVHTDSRAATAAEAVQARAYTVGTDIVFGSGEYQPAAAAGKHLLAHELAHTVQQSGGQAAALQRKLKVGAGLTLDTQGFATSKTGDVYTCPKVVKGSLWNEIFTSLLFSPRVFELEGATNAEINASLLAHMKARLGIVTFAGNKKYKFGAGANFKMNPAFWIVDANGYRPKPGVDRQKAIEDLNAPGNVGDPAKEYHIACLAATELTMEGGAKSGVFDFGSSADITDWIPGDWGYITNIKFPPDGSVPPGIPGLEGENIIYTGKDLFWGHFNPGLEYKTLADWIAEVNSFTPPTQAQLENQRTSTKVGLK
jgi:hypothetical protein